MLPVYLFELCSATRGPAYAFLDSQAAQRRPIDYFVRCASSSLKDASVWIRICILSLPLPSNLPA
eukprot:1743502-Pleurochrysis_carterae.AAC.8